MSKLQKFGPDGAAAGEIEIDDGILALEKGTQAVTDAVTAYRAGLRAGTASTRTRADVNGGGKKPFKQKGTGGARRGSSRSPVLKGGGTVFGPHPRDWSKKVNKKVAALAFRRALSARIAEGAVKVVEPLAPAEPKTKAFAALLKTVAPEGGKVLVAPAKIERALVLSARNLADADVTTAAGASTYQIARAGVIVTDAAGLDALKARLEGGNK
jgi:large subunit ribosomal protein L4